MSMTWLFMAGLDRAFYAYEDVLFFRDGCIDRGHPRKL